MKINAVRNNSVAFGDNQETNAQRLARLRGEIKAKKSALKKGESLSVETLKYYSDEFKDVKNVADKEIAERISKSKTETKIDKSLEKFFKQVIKMFGRSKSLIKEELKNPKLDLAAKVTTAVLIGNTLKELVGTCLYTTQAWTNEDLPKDKRKFVGIYDFAVGIVSTTISFIFGVGLEKKIKKGYVKLFKPLEKFPRTASVTVGIAAMTSFVLQTIVGKRMLAPAIATPLAGKAKKAMQAKDDAKKAQENGGQTTTANAAPATNPLPTTKSGFVDLKAYVANANSKKA
jgi:hypothetical protein